MVKPMAPIKRVSVMEGLISDIIASIGNAELRRFNSSDSARGEMGSLLKSDYGAALRRSFDRSEIQKIVEEARRRVWRQLNREPVKIGPAQEFISRWSRLGVDFRLARMSSPQGLALMGFYVKKAPCSGRPLICVNTAHHPVAVATSFSHEMGHHVTADIFGSCKEPGRPLLYTAYAEHLNDPVELAADLLVSLGVFPGKIARKLFSKPERSKEADRENRDTVDTSFAKVLNYFRIRYHLSFEAHSLAEKKLQYLTGLVHYTQLRRALLDEYDL
jgi:hypothetical protein